MDWYQTLFELIDFRSFSNLWFWIILAVVWSSVSHWVLGVPYDMITRARKVGGQAEVDMRDVTRANINRIIYVVDTAGLWLIGFACFVLTSLALLGFYYGIELAQALFLLAFPLSGVGLLSLYSARSIEVSNLSDEELRESLLKHRLFTQVIGIFSIFMTTSWGMYQNFLLGGLHG